MSPWPSPEHGTHGNAWCKGWEFLKELGPRNQYRLYGRIEGFMIRLLIVIGVVWILCAFPSTLNDVDMT